MIEVNTDIITKEIEKRENIINVIRPQREQELIKTEDKINAHRKEIELLENKADELQKYIDGINVEELQSEIEQLNAIKVALMPKAEEEVAEEVAQIIPTQTI